MDLAEEEAVVVVVAAAVVSIGEVEEEEEVSLVLIKTPLKSFRKFNLEIYLFFCSIIVNTNMWKLI